LIVRIDPEHKIHIVLQIILLDFLSFKVYELLPILLPWEFSLN